MSDADQLRRHLGLAGQYAAVDEGLTGEENLQLFGRLYGMRRGEARKPGDELLEHFALEKAGKRVVSRCVGITLAFSVLATRRYRRTVAH